MLPPSDLTLDWGGGGKEAGGFESFDSVRSFTEPVPVSPSMFRGLIPGGARASVEDTLSRWR